MSEATTARSRKRSILTEPTIVASFIAGICALAAAVVPPLLTSRTDPAPSATPVAQPVLVEAVPQPAVASRVKPNLTYGSWTLHSSRDDDGTAWNNSVVKFTSQDDTADGLRLIGYFEWRENGQFVGREHFVANYVEATRHLFIEGQRIEQEPDGRLGIGSFSATLSEDGRCLIDGTWGSSAGNQDGVPGGWEARR